MEKQKEISWLIIITYFLFAIAFLGFGIFLLKKGVFYDDLGNRNTLTESPGMFWFGTMSMIFLGIYTLILFIKNIYLKIKKK
jgi:hypothetical protein